MRTPLALLALLALFTAAGCSGSAELAISGHGSFELGAAQLLFDPDRPATIERASLWLHTGDVPAQPEVGLLHGPPFDARLAEVRWADGSEGRLSSYWIGEDGLVELGLEPPPAGVRELALLRGRLDLYRVGAVAVCTFPDPAALIGQTWVHPEHPVTIRGVGGDAHEIELLVQGAPGFIETDGPGASLGGAADGDGFVPVTIHLTGSAAELPLTIYVLLGIQRYTVELTLRDVPFQPTPYAEHYASARGAASSDAEATPPADPPPAPAGLDGVVASSEAESGAIFLSTGGSFQELMGLRWKRTDGGIEVTQLIAIHDEDGYQRAARFVMRARDDELWTCEGGQVWILGEEAELFVEGGQAWLGRDGVKEREREHSARTIPGFALFAVVESRPFDPEAVLRFDFLDLDMLRWSAGHTLTYEGSEERDGLPLHRFVHRAPDERPTTYLVDDQHRLRQADGLRRLDPAEVERLIAD